MNAKWTIAVLFVLVVAGCRERRNYAQDYKVRKIVDSLVRPLRKQVDSTVSVQCSVRMQRRLAPMVDSILKVRREEVERILRREAQENIDR